MDAARLAALTAEIEALPTFITNYDKSINDYLNGITPTCVNFLDVIPNLSDDISSGLAYDASWSGQGSSYGSLLDFVYEVNAIRRCSSILVTNKLDYYLINDTQSSNDTDFNNGEAAKTMSYIVGNAPDQGVTI
jgi:hypothetical protein